MCTAALQHAGKHMEDSIVASYTALLLGCLCQGSQVRALHRVCATNPFPPHPHRHPHTDPLSAAGKCDLRAGASTQGGFLHHDGNAEEVPEFHEPHSEY